MAPKEKKTEQLLVRLTPTQADRVKSVAVATDDEPVAMARRGLMNEVERLEATLGKPVSPAHARLSELLLTVPEAQVLAKLGEIAQEAASVAVTEDASCH